MIAQEFIEGKELELPIIIAGEDVLPLHLVGLEINGKKDLGDTILTYEFSEKGSYTYYNFDITDVDAINLYAQAKQIIKILNLKDYCRLEFRINRQGKFFLIDISTTPYLTSHSSFAFAFQQNGVSPEHMHACVVGAHIYKSFRKEFRFNQ